MSQRYRVFIDGQAGTTGLQIQQRLANHPHIDLLNIEDARRKDASARQDLMKQADITILCLPDAAAREAVTLADNIGARVLDASSAHRVLDGWIYGLPELDAGQRDKIRNARRVSNPGCYATGAIALLAPLTRSGRLPSDYPLTINAVSGYSGGGKTLIEKYQQQGTGFAAYGLGFDHKHINEIQTWGGLTTRPVFLPGVGDYAQGMLVFIPLNGIEGEPLHRELTAFYTGQPFVQVRELNSLDEATAPYLLPEALNNSNSMELFVFTHPQQSVLVARLDNLGKGASGAAVQNLNIMLGLPEDICVNL